MPELPGPFDLCVVATCLMLTQPYNWGGGVFTDFGQMRKVVDWLMSGHITEVTGSLWGRDFPGGVPLPLPGAPAPLLQHLLKALSGRVSPPAPSLDWLSAPFLICLLSPRLPARGQAWRQCTLNKRAFCKRQVSRCLRPPSQSTHGVRNNTYGASLVAQWLRIHLPMQGTRVRALVRKIPRAAEQLSPCATATEPTSHSYWSPRA